jgi:hypothetical protein
MDKFETEANEKVAYKSDTLHGGLFPSSNSFTAHLIS